MIIWNGLQPQRQLSVPQNYLTMVSRQCLGGGGAKTQIYYATYECNTSN